ncbi:MULTISPECIES: hypothetical protein [Methylosinus]|uniref:hypothetical protein n=1 Tax=Methylosinus TaxID=425 RepID=UPI0001D2F21C|nr:MULTISPECIES: hypothetical protein [Methylosinus]
MTSIARPARRMLVHAKLFPCAHSCKYCLMGDKKLTRMTSERFLRLVERLLEWELEQAGEIYISYVLNYTSDYDRKTLGLVRDLELKFPRSYPTLSGITLGGLRWRARAELREWLLERQAFGCRTAHASLAGIGGVHDAWNGRAGNFDLIMSTLEIAGDIGMALGARLFVARSTLPHLRALDDMLNQLPKHDGDWRYALPFFYFGWGVRHEEERIDEKIRDALPAWMEPLIRESTREGVWRSEREWIDLVRSGRFAAREPQLILNVNDGNIEQLENMSCDEIVAEYDARTRAAYAVIPALNELCERYGDRDGTKIYPLQRCIEMKWLDLHLAEHPTDFERPLTHLQMGN